MAHLPKPLALIEIPSDLIIDIISLLDIKDVLMLRLTCRLLDTISRERSVWITRLKQKKIPVPLQILKPLTDYSSLELERIVTQLSRVNQNWSSTKPEIYRIQDIQLSDDQDCDIAAKWSGILPGGRWLLVLADTGLISVWDLDEIPATRSVLVDLRPRLADNLVVTACYFIYPNEDGFGFDLAIATTTKEYSAMSFIIYHGKLDIGPNQLVVTHAASFSFENVTALDVVALDQERAACTARYGRHVITAVFEWRKCTGDVLMVSRFWNRRTTAVSMYLLPNNRSICYYDDSIAIYLLPEQECLPVSAQLCDKGAHEPIMIWNRVFPVFQTIQSRPVIHPKGHQFDASLILLGYTNITVVEIPSESDNIVCKTLYPVTQPTIDPDVITRKAIYWRHSDMIVLCTVLSSPDGAFRISVPAEKYSRVNFDELSGRVGLLISRSSAPAAIIRIMYFG